MVRALAWLIPGKTFRWFLVTMKISSLDTEVMATALHPVAICALCVLHHFEIRLMQSIDFSMLPFRKLSVSFLGSTHRKALRFSEKKVQPHHTDLFFFLDL